MERNGLGLCGVLFLLIVMYHCGSPDQGSGPGVEPTPVLNEQPLPDPALLAPSLARLEAPARFQVEFETTKGTLKIEVMRDWAPRGADRFFSLVRAGYFENASFFRVLEAYIAQFGVHADPEINQIWAMETIRDDEVKMSNQRGVLSFAQSQPNSRTTQLFINLKDNPELDSSGLAPVGRVIEGMSVADSIYAGYGELHPKGKGPRPKLLQSLGNKYLKRQFLELDYIVEATILE